MSYSHEYKMRIKVEDIEGKPYWTIRPDWLGAPVIAKGRNLPNLMKKAGAWLGTFEKAGRDDT